MELRPTNKNNYLLLSFLAVVIFLLTLFNLLATEVIDGACGFIHPFLFEIDLDFINDENDRFPFSEERLPITPPPSGEFGAEDWPSFWESCLQYWSYIGEDGFSINSTAIEEFAGEGLADSIYASVGLSETGTIFFYLILPSLVLLMPLFTIAAIRRSKTWLWLVMGLLVVSQTLTSALLYIHFNEISGIEPLAEFGFGIFGGTTTGTAIAFLGKMFDIFGDGD